MKTVRALLALALTASPMSPAAAADDTKVKQGTSRVESGADKIGEGVKEAAKQEQLTNAPRRSTARWA